MKYTIVVVLCTFAISVFGAPQDVQVVDYANTNDGLGNYNFKYALSDDTKHEQTGELRTIDDSQAVVMTGSFEFRDDLGNLHKVTYTADENGFHPVVES